MGNREEFYVYDGDDVVLDFVDANGATGGVSPVLKTRYLHGPAVDQILAQEEIDTTTGDSADVLWMLTDHLGSVRDIVNQAGEAVSHVTYDAFGNIVGGTGVLLTRYLYTGRELDTLTGLQYNRNRWYDPALGRWISEDPIGFAGGDYNQGRYVFNSSTVFIDPEGTVFWFAVAAAVGVYWFWPDTANAPAPADPLVPSAPYDGLGPAAFTAVSPGWMAMGASVDWADENGLLPQQNDIPPDAAIGMCPPVFGRAFPKRALPRTQHGVPKPTVQAPHTQLGFRNGRNGTYPQAREFNAEGQPVRDIDFTNHGRPNHPNPHQHRWIPDPKGGSPKRGPAEPLPSEG